MLYANEAQPADSKYAKFVLRILYLNANLIYGKLDTLNTYFLAHQT